MHGFTWYSLTDQIDWQHALRVERNDLHPVGLYDLASPAASRAASVSRDHREVGALDSRRATIGRARIAIWCARRSVVSGSKSPRILERAYVWDANYRICR